MTTKQQEIEKILNKRLKFLGFILLFIAAFALIWDFLPSAEEEIDRLILEIDEPPPPPLNPYLVSVVFIVAGSSCFVIHWKKKNSLSSENNPES